MSEKKDKGPRIHVQIDEDTAQGVYSNLAQIYHTDAEFVLDFIFVPPKGTQGKVRSRVILSPDHMERLVAAMQQNLRCFKEEAARKTAAVAEPQSGEDSENYH